jgi:uncharacterized protein with von Willebrand factor type A (vWA) domain
MKNLQSDEEMIKYLSSKYHIVKKDVKVKEKLLGEISDFEKKNRRKLLLENPFYENKKAFENAKKDLLEKKGIDIQSDLKKYTELENISACKINKSFWNKEISLLKERVQVRNKKVKTKKVVKDTLEHISKDAQLTRRLLQEKWEKTLDEEYAKWELQILQKYREEFMKKLEEWLELLQLLSDTLNDTSLDYGVLFDLSEGNISLQDIQEIKKWAEYISKNKGVQELLNMLGRLRQTEKSSKKELVKSISYIKEQVVDSDSKEEIVGITLGKDLAHALPQELALLSDDDTSLLFDMKYVEGRIMSFDMQGMSENIKEVQEEKFVEISEDEEKGPIIICVDTSGSMQGSPETIAKAITLYMATKAIEDKRACYLINFSIGIESMDLSGKMGIQKIIEFLKKSFNGGTDASPALSHAVDMLQEEQYKKADVLMISDFVMGSLSQDVIKKILKAKENKNNFYSLVIGNIFLHKQIKSAFDNEWVYNSQNNSIESLVDNLKSVDNLSE